MPDKETAVTPAADWRTVEDRTITLTSGNVLRVREVPFVWLAATGRIPPFIVAIQKRHEADQKPWKPEEVDRLLDWLITVAAVEPEITLAKKAGALHVKALSDVEKEDIVLALNLMAYVPRG